MKKRKIGIKLIIGAIVIWLIDRFSLFFSDFFGKIFCGDSYLQPVDGFFGDVSCGFNADMYLTAVLFIVLLIGITLLITAKK